VTGQERRSLFDELFDAPVADLLDAATAS